MTFDQETVASTDSETGRGRPRDQERTAAILDATHDMMKSKGWNDLTMGDIAKAAGCGLATIYRRWNTKEDLVAAAMRDRPLPLIDETGDARPHERTASTPRPVAPAHGSAGASRRAYLTNSSSPDSFDQRSAAS